MKGLVDITSKPAMIVFCGFGIGMYWTWSHAYASSASNPSLWLVNVLSHCITLALLMAVSNKVAPFFNHRILTLFAPVGMVISAVAFFFIPMLNNTYAWLSWTSQILAGLSSAILFLLWVESFARFTIIREQELITYLAIIIGSALNLFITALPEVLESLFIGVLPIVMSVFIAIVSKSPPSDITRIRARGSSLMFKTILPLRLILCAFVFSIPLGYYRSNFSADRQLGSSIALLLILIVIVFELFFKKRGSTPIFQKMLVLLISGGMLSLSFFAEDSTISGAAIATGSLIFRAYLYQICGLISLRTKVPPAKVFAFSAMIGDIGWLAGLSLMEILDILPQTWLNNIAIGIAYLILVIGMLALTKRYDFFRHQAPAHIPDLLQAIEQDSDIQTAAERIAIEHSFTQREKEIAILLVSGMNKQQIADKTFSSKNTVKTHVTHIYRKSNIHSINELRELFSQNGL
jgi:DNA-binding CsgD family transcriptional regulator